MDFEGTFTLEDRTMEEVWLGLSDPVLIRNSLPGCQFLLEVEDESPDFDELRDRAADIDDEDVDLSPEAVAERAFEEEARYVALMEISIGPVSPSFETTVEIVHREFPEMRAEGEGSASNSSFDVEAGMKLSQDGDDVVVEWWAEADVFGRIAQMGQRMINPVANRVIKQFFNSVQNQLDGLNTEASSSSGGLTGSIKSKLGM